MSEIVRLAFEEYRWIKRIFWPLSFSIAGWAGAKDDQVIGDVRFDSESREIAVFVLLLFIAIVVIFVLFLRRQARRLRSGLEAWSEEEQGILSAFRLDGESVAKDAALHARLGAIFYAVLYLLLLLPIG